MLPKKIVLSVHNVYGSGEGQLFSLAFCDEQGEVQYQTYLDPEEMIALSNAVQGSYDSGETLSQDKYQHIKEMGGLLQRSLVGKL